MLFKINEHLKNRKIMKTFENTVVHVTTLYQAKEVCAYYNLNPDLADVAFGFYYTDLCFQLFNHFEIRSHSELKFYKYQKAITFQQWKALIEEGEGLKVTPGEWKAVAIPDGPVNHISAANLIGTVCEFKWNNQFMSDKEINDNAKLIVDAGNTYNECQTLPSELLRQRDEAIDFAIDVMHDMNNKWVNHDLNSLKSAIQERFNKFAEKKKEWN